MILKISAYYKHLKKSQKMENQSITMLTRYILQPTGIHSTLTLTKNELKSLQTFSSEFHIYFSF